MKKKSKKTKMKLESITLKKEDLKKIKGGIIGTTDIMGN